MMKFTTISYLSKSFALAGLLWCVSFILVYGSEVDAEKSFLILAVIEEASKAMAFKASRNNKIGFLAIILFAISESLFKVHSAFCFYIASNYAGHIEVFCYTILIYGAFSMHVLTAYIYKSITPFYVAVGFSIGLHLFYNTIPEFFDLYGLSFLVAVMVILMTWLSVHLRRV